MKKIIIILFGITIFYCIVNGEEQILIPQDSIRFRVIANSDSEADQKIKMQIKDSVEKEINHLMLQAQNINEARNLIQNNLSKIDSIVKEYNVNYQMNFGINEFPEKEYKGVKYAEGNYESLVITLGQGIGKNWWCVMFPPLCLLEAEENNMDEVEYQFFIKNIIEKYL